MNKCALFDTDFISKLYITRKDDKNRLIDRVMELPGYQFACHEQICIELGRHNTSAVIWLRQRIVEGSIKKFTDADLEKKTNLSETEFSAELSRCDVSVGCDNNLGEIKTYVLQQVLQNINNIQLYVFCSDDKRARAGLSGTGGIPCISALSSFYVLKERLHLERGEAKQYFDSWMQLHQVSHQTAFKIHKNTKEMQMMDMDGYEIFERIYNGTITILKNGNLKLR